MKKVEFVVQQRCPDLLNAWKCLAVFEDDGNPVPVSAQDFIATVKKWYLDYRIIRQDVEVVDYYQS